MRIFILFICIGLTSSYGYNTYSQTKLDVNLNNGTLEELFDQIHDQSEFIFFYNDGLVKKNRNISINLKQATVAEILSKALEKTNLAYKVVDRQVVITKAKKKAALKVAQNIDEVIQNTITGTVVDADGLALPGANVLVKGTTNGTQTDFDGNFTIDADENAVLVFSYIGYATQEVTVAGKTSINVTMAEDASKLEEIVVIGYGTKQKSLVTGAISSIKAEQFENSSNQRVEQALQGRISGVTVVSSSGSPGAGAKVRIRGAGSNGNADPLYVVDGLRVAGIQNISPNDIANIEILKDAASAAIYGTDAANGVILITTKQGKVGESVISYNSQIGVQSVRTKMELMDADQFVQYMQEAGQAAVVSNGVNTDWIDETFEDAFFQRHDLSFSGATEKTSYYISGSVLDQDGIVGGGNSSFKRYSLRANIKSDVKDWLEVGTNINFTNTINQGIPENNDTRSVIQNLLIIDPLTPVLYPGATPQSVIDLANDNGVPLLTNGRGGVYGYPTYSNGEVINPVAFANEIANNVSDDGKIIATTYAKIKFTDNLTFTTRFGIERGDFFRRNISRPYYVSSEAQNSEYILTEDKSRSTKWQWENFLTYDRTFGDHDFTLLAGYSAEKTVSPFGTTTGSAAPGDFTDPFFNNLKNFGTNPTGSLFRDNLTSGFGRLSYSYLDKYLFEGSVRYDQSDKFPKKDRGAIFPAASVGWVASKEDFWKEDSAISYLKFRASWGQNGSKRNLAGNSELNFLISQVDPSQGGPLVFEGFGAVQSGAIPNDNLKWEVSEQLDLGVDLRGLNNRFSFAADYYVKTTKDLILNDGGLITPGSAGGVIKEFNGGTIQNKGLEFELGWNETTDSGFSYGINFNLSTLKNEVTETVVGPDRFIRGAGAPQNSDGVTRFQEGFPVWYFYGFKTDGIDPATGEIIIVDTDGVDGIDANDKTQIGSPHPDLLFGGNVSLGYKGFDFNLQFQGTSGNDIFSTYHQVSRPISNKSVEWFENRWTPTNTNASFPAAEFASTAYQTDLVVEDGSYMRIKQIQLGYTLPGNLVDSIHLKKVRLYLSLDDFFTFTKYTGLDPETGSFDDNAIGVDRGFYPVAAKAIFGLSVDF